MGSPLITSLYAVPLGLMGFGLAAHVIMERAKTGVSIMDGGHVKLAERIRRHGNFMENVPLILLIMALAEMNGVGSLWLHASGVLLIIGRLLHAAGLKHDQPTAIGRTAGMSITILSGLTAICSIIVFEFMK
jgi:uncharacterized protein